MSKKSKSRTNPLAELQFIANVQLEQAVQMLGNIADEQHQVTLTEVSPDEFEFHINYLPNKSREAEINGKLQRWQGTETKINASGNVIHLLDSEENTDSSGRQVIIIALFAFFGGFIAILNGSWIFGVSTIIITAPIVFFLVDWQSNERDDKSTLSFRERDYLLQRMIDTFKSEHEVEIYDPEISSKAQTSSKS